MKKIVLIIASSLIGVSAFAQEGFHIGVKGGTIGTFMYNQDLSNSDKDYVETRQKFGSSFAITTDYHFSETIGLGVDLTFVTLGQDYIYYSSGNIDATLTANYMRVPLLLHFNSDPGSAVMFKGFLGPQISLLNGATLASSYSPGTGKEDPLVVTNSDNEEFIYTDRAGLSPLSPVNGGGDVEARMESSTIGAVLGLGIAINVTDFLNIDLGATMGYEFTDAGTPFEAVDVPNTETDFLFDVGAPTTSPTNIINAGFNIGLNFIID